MKKILLTIALVSSLAFSTVASAAVNYNGATDISADLSYAGGILDVATDVYNASSTKDVTLVVVAGENPTDIVQGDIMYIDQIDMPAAGAETFQDLGLLIPENTKKATVIINNGGVALLSGTVSVEEAAQTEEKVFAIGDTDNTGAVEAKDGLDILSWRAGAASATINTKVTGINKATSQEQTIAIGDTDNTGAVEAKDGLDILSWRAGAASATINTKVTLIVEKQ